MLDTSPLALHMPTARTWRVVGGVLLAHLVLFGWLQTDIADLPAAHASGAVVMADLVTERTALSSTATASARATPTPKPRVTPTNSPSLSSSDSASSRVAVAPSGETTPSTSSVAMAGTPSLVLPSADADYLQNPPPTYPRMSRRMGEQGTVVVRVFISPQGSADKAEVRTSSGYPRLDQAALDAVLRWRFVPGRRAGVAEAMWFNVPVRFVLE